MNKNSPEWRDELRASIFAACIAQYFEEANVLPLTMMNEANQRAIQRHKLCLFRDEMRELIAAIAQEETAFDHFADARWFFD